MRSQRKCSRSGCDNPAVATLTYAYVDSTAVVGPLASQTEPHSYDLCEVHAVKLTVPRGWEVVRHEGEFADDTEDDLTALAEAVREAGRDSAVDSRSDIGRNTGRDEVGSNSGRKPGGNSGRSSGRDASAAERGVLDPPPAASASGWASHGGRRGHLRALPSHLQD